MPPRQARPVPSPCPCDRTGGSGERAREPGPAARPMSAQAASALPEPTPAAVAEPEQGRGWIFVPAAAAAAALLVHFACGNRYGVFRDEMYFLACGRHLAWGYVDQPPAIAVLARIAAELAGTTVMGLRWPAYLAHAATILVTARLAARLGGGRVAQALAAVVALASSALLGATHLLTMNAFEPLLWTATALSVHRAVEDDRRGGWLLAGACVGIGLLNKYSLAFWVLALLAGLIATRARRALASPWLLAGAALAAALALPNFLWQAGRGFPMLEMLGHMGEKNAEFRWLGYATEVAYEQNLATAFIWIVGLVSLLRDRPAGSRWLGLAFLAVAAGIGLLHGKPYFLAPAFPTLLAAGACALVRTGHPARAAIATGAVAVLAGALSVPFSLPVLSPPAYRAFLARLGMQGNAPREKLDIGAPLPSFFADQFGWPELVASVAAARDTLAPEQRARVAVLVQDYGIASAIDLYGPGFGLAPASSAHNTYWYWGPPPDDATAVLLVGPLDHDQEVARRLCRKVERVGETPASEWNMPYERRRPIFACTELVAPFSSAWAKLRYMY